MTIDPTSAATIIAALAALATVIVNASKVAARAARMETKLDNLLDAIRRAEIRLGEHSHEISELGRWRSAVEAREEEREESHA